MKINQKIHREEEEGWTDHQSHSIEVILMGMIREEDMNLQEEVEEIWTEADISTMMDMQIEEIIMIEIEAEGSLRIK